MGAMLIERRTPSNGFFHPEPSIPRKRRGKRRAAALTLLLVCLMVSALGCGLIGGGDDEEEEVGGGAGDDIRAQIQAELAAEAEAAGSSEGASSADGEETAETESSTDTTTDTTTEAPPASETSAEVPADAAGVIAATVVENEEQARNLAWAHISQCITFNAAELNATLITGNWFVNGTDQASRDYGFWKIPEATAMVSPHDTQARKWETAIESQCSQDSMKSVPTQSRAVSDAAGASTAVWSYLVQCVPALSTEIFQSVFDPAKGQWTVVISQDHPDKLGTWVVNPNTGAVAPHTEPARLWDSAVRLGCTSEVVQPLLQPTPVPAPTHVVVEITAAVTNLWSYLVKCGPGLTEGDLQATWNPVKSEWIVITAPGIEVDYGVWTVRQDGSITPSNQEATRREELSVGGTC